MTTTVYIWRMGASESRLETGSSSLRLSLDAGLFKSVSEQIGGFGHVALEVGDHYLSYWPGELPGETRSFSACYSEDVDRCGRMADREIVIRRLAEGVMLDRWREWSQRPFAKINNNCCAMTARLLYVGAQKAPLGERARATARAALCPARSVWRLFSHSLAEALVHEPREVELFAEHLAYLY